MTISYPLALPTSPGGFRSVTFSGESAVAISRSPYTFASQVQAHDGKGWQGAVALPAMREATAAAWKAILLALNGQQGTFLLGVKDLIPSYAIRGAGGSGLVKGASQTGQTLLTDGWANGTLVLKAGDYIGLGTTDATRRFHMVLQDVTSDGSGNGSLTLWPQLRESPADNAALELTAPKAVFRLVDNAASWDVEAVGRAVALGFSFREAI